MTRSPAFHARASLLLLAAGAGALAGCTVGPNYIAPSAPLSARFKEAPGADTVWRPAEPLDAVPKGDWWSVFNDPVLDGLERQVAVNNQNVALAEATLAEARGVTAYDRSTFFPTVSANASATRSLSGSRTGGLATTTTTPITTSAGNGGTAATSTTATSATGQTLVGVGVNAPITTYSAGLQASWAPDLWGRIRRTVEGDVANAQALAADVANARLLAQAQLAQDYLTLRVLDEERRLYARTIQAYQKNLTIYRNQYAGGVVDKLTVITAETQLLSVQAQDASVEESRQQEEHAIAVLIGKPPAALTLAPATLSRSVPVAPADLPATLLQRRPDVAAAERSMKQANALIGVAIAAYYPSVPLTGQYGFESDTIGSLFNSAASFWSIGASAAETLIDFGGRKAQVQEAKATYKERVASYRQTVLTAIQGVEDELVALRTLQTAERVQEQEAEEAELAVKLATNEYRAGTVDFTTVVNDQATALAAEQSVLQTLEARQVASVALIQDLGGGWTTAELPRR